MFSGLGVIGGKHLVPFGPCCYLATPHGLAFGDRGIGIWPRTQFRQKSRWYNPRSLPLEVRTMRLENKVALISGGARGMGAAEARLFTSKSAVERM